MSFSNPENNVRELGIKPGEKVVIFGSGAGGHTFAVAHAMKGTGMIYGIDSRAHMVEKLKKEVSDRHHMNVRIMNGNIDRDHGTGIQSLSTDAVIIPDSFFSHKNKEAIVEEAYRILKPRGRLLVVEWKASFHGAGPQPENIFPEDQALEMVQSKGFEYDRKFSAGNYHYALLFRKPS